MAEKQTENTDQNRCAKYAKKNKKLLIERIKMSDIKLSQFGVMLIVLVMILVGCSSEDPETTPTTDPETVMTAAAQTSEARLTEIAKSTASQTPAPTTTSQPSGYRSVPSCRFVVVRSAF